MKTLQPILALTISLACALLAGCSKSDANKPPEGVRNVTPEGKMDMRFDWIVGKQYFLRMDIQQSSQGNLPNQNQPMNLATTIGQDYTISVVKELPNDGRQLELEITDARFSTKMGDRVLMTFDSQDKTADTRNPLAPIFRKMIGGKVSYIVNASGRVEKVQGARELADRALAGTSADTKASFSSMFSEGFFRQLCDVGRMAPSRGVKPGDSWPMKFEEEYGNVGTLQVDLKLKFTRWEDHGGRRCARIESKGEMESHSSGGGAQMSIEKGESTGVAWFDPELGMIVESDADQDMKMNIPVQGRAVPMSIKQKVLFKLVDVADMPK